MNRTLYVMCGVAFSGKSTLARALATAKGCQIVSLDDINAERGVLPGGEGLLVEEWRRTADMARERVSALMETGVGIVLDDTSCFRFLRDGYRALAARHGYRARVVFVDTPIGEVRGRIERNKVTNHRSGIRETILEEHLKSFEPPGADEDVVVYFGGDALEWIERMLAEVEGRHGPR